MFRKAISLFLALALIVGILFTFSACSDNAGEQKKLGESEPLLPITTVAGKVTVDYEVPDDFKIGFIMLHDENSTYDLNFINAAKRLQEILGLTDDQIIIVTNIPEGEECYNKARDLAGAGCKVIFADSFGHDSYMLQAAKDFPEVQFCHATGTLATTAGVSNYHNAFASIYEGRYLAGIAAGLKLNEMIASGKITAEQAVMGYVGAFTYAEVISGLTSFYLGAKSVCPSVTMKVRFTGSWYDQPGEQEAATALIEQDHCVLISQHADSLGAPSACEMAGVPNVSYNGSTYSAGENTFIISSAINWTPYYLLICEKTIKGEAIPANWCGGISENSVALSGINQDVMAEGTIEKLNDTINQFKSGTLHVFATENFTVKGEHLTEYLADIDGDYTGDTNVIHDGYFDESGDAFRSAPYFDIEIDGIEYINRMY